MSNRLAFAALAVACISAAAGGGYLASRQNAIPTPAAAQSAPAAQGVASPTTSATPAAPVQETEAIVGDAQKNAPASADSKPSSPAPRRSDASARTPARDARPNSAAATTSARREQSAPRSSGTPGTLTSSWPSSAAQAPATPAAPPISALPETPRADDHAVQESRPPEPPKPTFEELVIARDSVIGLQTENRISSETARIEDRVDARVTRDVKVGDRVAIPAGSRVIGTVTQVERGGKFKEQARLGIRFNTIVLGDGARLPISTETIVRLGEAPGNGTAAKIGGGAVGGAILGAILGGAKGAAIGATAGAGAGTAAVEAGDRSAVVLQAGTPLTPRILSPVTVTIDRERDE